MGRFFGWVLFLGYLFQVLAVVNLNVIIDSAEPVTLRSSVNLNVIIDSYAASSAKKLLNHVLPEIRDVFEVIDSSSSTNSNLVEYSLSPSWRSNTGTSSAEQCVRQVIAHKPLLHVHFTCNGLLGLAFSLHSLRERIALRNMEIIDEILLSDVSAPPAFGVRAWSEEGTLLAIPDRGYYSADGNSTNTEAITTEALSLEAEIIPALLRLRMNSLIVLHSDIEDYVTYDTLSSFFPGAPAVYSQDDPHRIRRAGVISVMAPWIAHLRDDFGIAFFLQVYELSSPPGVCSPFSSNGPPALFNCTLGSPAVKAIIETKYTELFSAVPAIAGIFVTVEDSWTPRAGYVFNVLWSEQSQLPVVVNLFHDAIVNTGGKQLYFRLWVFGEPVDWPNLRDNTSPDVRFSVKQTQGDFLLDFGINNLLKCINGTCPAHDRRLIIEVDAFRQYNGWTSAVAWMGSQWGPRLSEAIANANGTSIDVWGWGSWAPGCTWPDSGPTLINGTAGSYKSWRSWWSTYRLFNATETNGGFSLGGQSNAYLLYRLSWDTQPNETQIALDFGTLFYGKENAEAIAQLLNASFYSWLPTSSPSGLGDFTLFWTMMQHDVGTFSGLAKKFTLAEFDAAESESSAAIDVMESALALVDPSKIPLAYPNAYNGAARAVSMTRHYLSAAFSWRNAGLSVAQLGATPTPTQCADSKRRVALLLNTTTTFGQLFPIEGAQWVVSSLDESLYSHPPFLNSSERTMFDFVERWLGQVSSVCK